MYAHANDILTEVQALRRKINMAWKPLLEGQAGVYLSYSGDIILAHSLIVHLHPLL
jgi:hypothetical protein